MKLKIEIKNGIFEVENLNVKDKTIWYKLNNKYHLYDNYDIDNKCTYNVTLDYLLSDIIEEANKK